MIQPIRPIDRIPFAPLAYRMALTRRDKTAPPSPPWRTLPPGVVSNLMTQRRFIQAIRERTPDSILDSMASRFHATGSFDREV